MHKRGFGLIEVLVSTILIVLTITGLAHLFLAGRRLLFLSHTRMTGGELGKVFLDPLQMDVRQDQWGAGNNCLSSNPTNTSACPPSQNVSNINYTRTYNITDVSGTNLRRATVNITWNETLPP